MDKFNKNVFSYYATVSVVSIPVILSLIMLLSWPQMASAVFGGVLYIHVLARAKLFRDLYEKAERKGLTTAVAKQLKSLLIIQSPNQETEV